MNREEGSLAPPQVLAHYDEKTVTVYQAFCPEIVRVAVELGTFGRGFGMNRMTWIKPSFGWMLHRSSYATASNQEAIARIRITREGFDTILEEAVLTRQSSAHESVTAWTDALRRSRVRCQWDPDRTLRDFRMERRAIQLGISGDFVHRYVKEWIVGVEDVTALARAIGSGGTPEVPEERPYPVSAGVQQRLGCV